MYVLASNNFYGSFARHFPGLEVFNYHDIGKGIEQIKKAKLIIFPGGEDINPTIYNEPNTDSYFSIGRDEIEIACFNLAMSRGKKILGVCRGHQLINAMLGGKLIQDMDHPHHHEIKDVDSDFIAYFKEEGVNSLHHQAVSKLGDGLRITAMFDGYIEASENENIVTTQFHPEFLNTEGSLDFFSAIKQWVK